MQLVHLVTDLLDLLVLEVEPVRLPALRDELVCEDLFLLGKDPVQVDRELFHPILLLFRVQTG